MVSLDIEEQYDKIYRYCYFKLHSRELAEDVTQETYLRYFERYNGIVTASTLRYLYTIARNLCVDEYRKPKMEPMEESIVDNAMEEKLIENLAVRKALSRFAIYRKLLSASGRFREEMRKEEDCE